MFCIYDLSMETPLTNLKNFNATLVALDPLFKSFLEWKQGELPYYELTEHIHQFHKRNQDIYKEFNYTERDVLVLYAKMKLGRLSHEDISQYGRLLDGWGYRSE